MFVQFGDIEVDLARLMHILLCRYYDITTP
jgi:hypothetical protein